MITSFQQQAELEFWGNTFWSERSEKSYIDRRIGDFNVYAEFLPELKQEMSKGLDLACGLVSILEGLDTTAEIWAVDALMDEYDKIFCPRTKIHYQQEDGERLSFSNGMFDFVCCFNAIDHTPHPARMVAEIKRVLKPGGHFYFWVNFDRPPLCPAHYVLWNQELVDGALVDFHLLRATICWSITWQKYIYSAIYKNEVQH